MNRKNQLIIDFRDYRKDGKGSVNLQPFPSFAEMFLKLNKNLQLTLDETVFMS